MASRPSDEELQAYWRARDHHRHTCGCEQAADWSVYRNLGERRLHEARNRLPYCGRMDMAWLVMLHKKGRVPTGTARELWPVLRQSLNLEHFFEKYQALGDPSPAEAERLLGIRREKLRGATERQEQRKEQVAAAYRKMDAELKVVLA